MSQERLPEGEFGETAGKGNICSGVRFGKLSGSYERNARRFILLTEGLELWPFVGLSHTLLCIYNDLLDQVWVNPEIREDNRNTI